MKTFTIKPVGDITKLTHETIKNQEAQKRLEELREEEEFQHEVVVAQEDIMERITTRASTGLYNMSCDFFTIKFFCPLSSTKQERFITLVTQAFTKAGYRTSFPNKSGSPCTLFIEWGHH